MQGKLTNRMIEALQKLVERGECSAYAARVSVATMYALQRRGFAQAIGTGHMAFPASASWRPTTEGRAALAREGK